MQKTALILGGTGLVGSLLIKQMIEKSEYTKIIVLSRKSRIYDSDKVEVIVTDFKDYSFTTTLPIINSIFSCLGTTKDQTPDKTAYLAIELGIPADVLKSLQELNNIPSKIHVVSAIGANSKSGNFYLKMKGDLEQLIIESPITQKYIYQPAVILGERERKYKTWEKLVFSASKLIDKMLNGKSMKYHTIEASQIAKAMIHYDLTASIEVNKKFNYDQMIHLQAQ